MNAKSLGILGVVTALIVLAALFAVREDTQASGSDASDVLFPGLSAQVNDVARIAITKAGETVTLTRDGETWVCAEVGGYRAKFDQVKDTLISIARLELLDPMTADPAQHGRLGVDPTTGTFVTLSDAKGTELAAVVLGDTRYSRNGQQIYARRADQDQAWLCEADLTLAATPRNWVDTEILRLAAARPSRVELEHADGETVLVTRSDPAAPNWQVANVPAERGLKNDGVANPIASALSFLSFDDVKPASEVPLGTNHAVTARYTTFDGLVVEVRLARVGEENWVTLTAEHAAAPETVGPVAPEADSEAEAEAAARDAAAAEAAELAARFDGWAYRIPRRLEDLLGAAPSAPEAPAEEGAADSEADAATAVPVSEEAQAPEEPLETGAGAPDGDADATDSEEPAAAQDGR